MPEPRRPRRDRRGLHLAVSALMTMGLVAACSPHVQPAATEVSPSGAGSGAGPVPDSVAWSGCGGGLECATLEVPREYARSGSATITLSVIRRPATGTNRIGSLFVNPGGPGASGVTMVRANKFSSLNSRFDIVSWDPRGVGGSGPLNCDGGADDYRHLDWSPDTDEERQQLDAGARRIADDCGRINGDGLATVSTDATARDLDRLRIAVGDGQLSYLGFSYGTEVGLRYADLFPTHIRAMTLDGVVDPAKDLPALLAAQTAAIDQQIASVFAACERSGTCPDPHPGALYDRVAARVEVEPIPAGPDRLGPTDVAFAAIGGSYGESLTALIQALREADGGDGTKLRQLASSYFDASSYSSYVGVVCVDEPHPRGGPEYTALVDNLARISPRFGAAVANEVRPCAFWPTPATGRPAPVLATGSAPILIVGATRDLATPYADAQKVAGELDHAVLVTRNGAGHTSYSRSTCVSTAVDRYLMLLQSPPPALTCG